MLEGIESSVPFVFMNGYGGYGGNIWNSLTGNSLTGNTHNNITNSNTNTKTNPTTNKSNQLLLIYCHGSGSTLNHVYEYCKILQLKFSISILAYDYSGDG